MPRTTDTMTISLAPAMIEEVDRVCAAEGESQVGVSSGASCEPKTAEVGRTRWKAGGRASARPCGENRCLVSIFLVRRIGFVISRSAVRFRGMSHPLLILDESVAAPGWVQDWKQDG
jgi:hypothetical protein